MCARGRITYYCICSSSPGRSNIVGTISKLIFTTAILSQSCSGAAPSIGASSQVVPGDAGSPAQPPSNVRVPPEAGTPTPVVAVIPATDGGPDQGAQTIPTPDAGTPTPGCISDVECKGQRICVMGVCSDPSVQPVVDAGNDVAVNDQPDVETMTIDAGSDVMSDALPDTDSGSMVAADAGAADAWFMPTPVLGPGGAYYSQPPAPCLSWAYCECTGTLIETPIPNTSYVTVTGNCIDTAPAPIHCAGQADGGAPGYLDPSVSWAYDISYESNLAAVETESVTIDGVTDSQPCVIDMLSDTPQCPVSVEAPTGPTDPRLVFSYNPVNNVVHITQGSLSWTPRCN